MDGSKIPHKPATLPGSDSEIDGKDETKTSATDTTMIKSKGSDAESAQSSNEAGNTPKTEESDSHPSDQKEQPQRPDILYCLTVMQYGENDRSFFKDSPWKGISTGLPGSDPDENQEETAVLCFHVSADVEDKTKKEPNTPYTWRDNPVDFEFGRDAILFKRHSPSLRLYSKRLIKVIEQIFDYYPGLGVFDRYGSAVEDVFVEIMYCYGELREYLNSYVRTLPNDQQADERFDIGNCGDEKIADLLQKRLSIGALDLANHPCDEATAYDIAVLLRLLSSMYRVRVVPTLSSMLLNPKPFVAYESLWLLFKPGTYVYVRQSAFFNNSSHRRSEYRSDYDGDDVDDEFSAWVVASWRYIDKDPSSDKPDEVVGFLELEVWNVQYNQTTFQRIASDLRIVHFDGLKFVSDLKIIPANFYDQFNGGAVRQKLEKRGRRYLSILKDLAAHREYDDPRSGYQGQIIVDPDAHRLYSSGHWFYGSNPMLAPLPPVLDGGGGRRFRDLTNFEPSDSDTFERIDEVLVLFPRKIEGFGLKTKKWMVFEIDKISDSPPEPSPNQLDTELVLVSDADRESLRTVLPKGEQPLTLCPDFVQGKGEGKVFLLYGPPGTGKTLTVESVANDTCRPLLSLTAQDVGLDGDAESYLRQWFTLAAKWDAILLIDEADLFLEQRKEGNLTRNSLSTVFLRTMEYYKGVLFLTTNRPGHIDDSFISRITCPIAYHALSSETKEKIVRKFVKKFEETGTVEIDQAAVKYLVANSETLNGRQIRNVMQNAVASAEIEYRSQRDFRAQRSRADQKSQDAPTISVKRQHIKAAIERQTEFREYLRDVRGRDELARARSKQDYLTTAPRSAQ